LKGEQFKKINENMLKMRNNNKELLTSIC